MGNISAADFLSIIEDSLIRKEISEPQRKLLLRDMAGILDTLREVNNSPGDMTIKSMTIKSIHPVGLVLHSPRYRRNYENGKLLSEEWFSREYAAYSRDGDKPVAKFYYNNGNVEKEIWRANGMLHRDGDKPAIISYYTDGKVKHKKWATEGNTNRDGDEPAFIEYYESGIVMSEEWMVRGLLSRENDKPAVIEYFRDGAIKNQERWLDGLKRKDA